jgi:hypothetical protein
MIRLIASLLIEFPKLADIFFKIREEYIKTHKARTRSRMDDRIDEWVRGDSEK